MQDTAEWGGGKAQLRPVLSPLGMQRKLFLLSSYLRAPTDGLPLVLEAEQRMPLPSRHWPAHMPGGRCAGMSSGETLIPVVPKEGETGQGDHGP